MVPPPASLAVDPVVVVVALPLEQAARTAATVSALVGTTGPHGALRAVGGRRLLAGEITRLARMNVATAIATMIGTRAATVTVPAAPTIGMRQKQCSLQR